MTTMLDITCRDPIIARDGRPFGAGQGNRMRSLDWPPPSVLAGSLRTTLGKAADRNFSSEAAQDLLQVEIAGPLPRANGQLYLPAPEDCVLHPDGRVLRSVPQPEDKGGCDWPANGLLPIGVPMSEVSEDFKPKDAPAWWPVDRYAEWLAGEKDFKFNDQFLGAAEKEERTHVKIDPAAGAAEESQLFTTAALALSHLPRYCTGNEDDRLLATNGAGRKERFSPITLSVRTRAVGWCEEAIAKLDALHPFGGERRLAHWKTTADGDAWKCPLKLREKLAGTKRVRMILATPAIFRNGWKPGWLNEELIGAPRDWGLKLKLVGISIQRWKAVSGWSLAELPGQPRGPKPAKRIVPAGGVYFFEVVEGKASDLVDRWLEPVSDDAQDRRDGFGLAAWGVW